MKIVVATDSLKGSLSSLEAGEAIRDGILLADPDAEVVVQPVTDGGEGTTEALTFGECDKGCPASECLWHQCILPHPADFHLSGGCHESGQCPPEYD